MGRREGMGTCSGAAKRGSDLPGLKSVFCRKKKKKMMMKCFKKWVSWAAGQMLGILVLGC